MMTWKRASFAGSAIMDSAARTLRTPATPRATMFRWKRNVSPASKMIVGTPDRVAAARRVCGEPGMSTTISVPKARAMRRTFPFDMSARIWGRFVRPTLAVCRSTPYFACPTISLNSRCAVRAAAFPSGSPGK